MAPKASAHAVYDLKYHFVWTPKYRKELLIGEVAEATRKILGEIAEAYDMEIDTLEVMEDQKPHFHILIPRFCQAISPQILKSVSARELFA